MLENINLEFPVTVYGNLEKYNETISKGRCRIFYKYGNRNGTYITDEFADKLLATVPYAPVKGIFDTEEGDYTDHGTSRNQGRIYGIVPENPNLTWEDHVDEDGVTRTYACVDVLIFTGLYAEANAIIGKSQSMEIYQPSIKGEWKIINGKKYFVFESGHFLGLQALGDAVEPCFEGAAFFALYKDLKKIVEQIEKYELNQHDGGKHMLNYKLSDGAKFQAIWSLLNVNYCEAGGWMVEYDICEIYDDYAVVKNYAEGCWERVYYSKNDETDSVELGERVRCFFMDVTEAEKKALDILHGLNNNTYEKVDENYSAALAEIEAKNNELTTANEALAAANNTLTEVNETLTSANEALSAKETEYTTLVETHATEISNFETKIGELNESIATLTTERDDALSEVNEVNIAINNLKEENAALNSFKTNVETQQKKAVIAKYSELLDEEVVASYAAKLDNYVSAEALDKDLAYEWVSNNQSVFTNGGQSGVAYIPKDEPVTGGLEEILSKYKKN